ncbi:hypothetical protein [Photobacterium swingsii]|uniref:hypothetical protein n=1 Tax=Photobacterium swingsii TaxID=680026 RepID=UPI0040681610
MDIPNILNLEHELRVPTGFDLTLVMHEYGLYVSQSQLITHWYSFRLLALSVAFYRDEEARRVMYSLPKQSDLFSLQCAFQLCVHQTCSDGFKPSKVQFSYSFVNDDDARETIDEFWLQLLKQVKCLEGLRRAEG